MGPILFVDDDDTRIDAFLKVFPDAEWARTAQEAIEKIRQHPHFWILSLDHDLGPEEAGDGVQIALWLMTHKPSIDLIIVHSWNVIGAAKMLDILTESGYTTYRNPFGIVGG